MVQLCKWETIAIHGEGWGRRPVSPALHGCMLQSTFIFFFRGSAAKEVTEGDVIDAHHLLYLNSAKKSIGVLDVSPVVVKIVGCDGCWLFLGPRPAYGKFFKLRNDMTWWHACWFVLNPWCGSLWHQILAGQWRCIKMSCRMWEKSWHCWPWCLMPSSLAIKGSRLGIWWEL